MTQLVEDCVVFSYTCNKVIFGKCETNLQIISSTPGITLVVCSRTRNLDLILEMSVRS